MVKKNINYFMLITSSTSGTLSLIALQFHLLELNHNISQLEQAPIILM